MYKETEYYYSLNRKIDYLLLDKPQIDTFIGKMIPYKQMNKNENLWMVSIYITKSVYLKLIMQIIC